MTKASGMQGSLHCDDHLDELINNKHCKCKDKSCRTIHCHEGSPLFTFDNQDPTTLLGCKVTRSDDNKSLKLESFTMDPIEVYCRDAKWQMSESPDKGFAGQTSVLCSNFSFKPTEDDCKSIHKALNTFSREDYATCGFSPYERQCYALCRHAQGIQTGDDTVCVPFDTYYSRWTTCPEAFRFTEWDLKACNRKQYHDYFPPTVCVSRNASTKLKMPYIPPPSPTE